MFEQVHRRCMTHKLRAEVSWLDVVRPPVANMKVQLLTFRHLIETLVKHDHKPVGHIDLVSQFFSYKRSQSEFSNMQFCCFHTRM